MSLLNDFYRFATEQGISKEDILEEKGDGFHVVAFGEEGEPDTIYNVALVLYDNDNEVEIFIRKMIDSSDLTSLFEKVNTLNMVYRGVAFYLEKNLVTLKSYCKTSGNIETVLKQMVGCMHIAAEEFAKF